MGFLGRRLAPIRRRSIRQVRLAEFLADEGAGARDGVRRQIHRVRAHVCDVAGLVESLRDRHGPAHREAEPRRRSLLQSGSNERRVGPCAGLPILALVHRERRPSQPSKGFVRRLGVRGPKALAAVFRDVEAMAVGTALGTFPTGVPSEIRESFPVFFRRERANFTFAFGDQAYRDGLHAAGRQAPGHLGPQ